MTHTEYIASNVYCAVRTESLTKIQVEFSSSKDYTSVNGERSVVLTGGSVQGC